MKLLSFNFRNVGVATAVVAAMLACTVVEAAFTPFVIRNGASSSPQIVPNNDYVPGALEFIISEGGQKAGLGTSQSDGQTIGDMTQWKITRHDDPSRFTAGSGPAVAPYINIWITDGAGKYAVVANEPSNPDFQPLYNNGYDLDWNDVKDKPAKRKGVLGRA